MQYRNHRSQISDHAVFVGWIRQELLLAAASVPEDQFHPHVIWPRLETLFAGVDWTMSFHKRLLVVYDEVVIPQVVISLHEWLRSKCANLDHIHVIFTDQPIQLWWQAYCRVFHERSFHAEYVPHVTMPLRYPMAQTIQVKAHEMINRHFSYYAGTWHDRSRNYLLLEMLEYMPHAAIDNMGLILPRQRIVDYVEQISYFGAQSDVERIGAIYDQHVIDQNCPGNVVGQQSKNEPLCYQGLQWQIDSQCFACVTRETRDDLPYPDVTEKTMRAFLHQCMVIPISYQAVDHLESLGFQFAHHLFDYSYQHQPDFFHRVKGLKNSLNQFIQTVSQPQLGPVWFQNQQIWQHNAENVLRIMKPDHKVLAIPDCV